MKVTYEYKGKSAEDIREFTKNGKLEIDKEWLFKDYLPFQVFITCETMYEGLTIRVSPDASFINVLDAQEIKGEKEAQEIIDASLSRHGCVPSESTAAAVSGGIDSSTVALFANAKALYSGYYNQPGFDEREFAVLVADELRADYQEIRLTEDDFLQNWDRVLEAIGVPIGGPGAVMEFTALEKYLESHPSTRHVLFGNGGDEIWMGYPWNEFMKQFMEISNLSSLYMKEFKPQKVSTVLGNFDMLLAASISRIDPKKLHLSPAYWYLVNELSQLSHPISKILYVNIWVTLPSLLHLNQQMCKALDVIGVNPLADDLFILHAPGQNSMRPDLVPKAPLRWLHPRLPVKIRNRTDKMGFPIPWKFWPRAEKEFKSLWESFQRRSDCPSTFLGGSFPGVNRLSWAVANIEKLLRSR